MAKAKKQTAAEAPAVPEMKPGFTMELEQIESPGDLNVGDEVTLEVTAKVTSMSQDTYSKQQDVMTRVGFEIQHARVTDHQPEAGGASEEDGADLGSMAEAA